MQVIFTIIMFLHLIVISVTFQIVMILINKQKELKMTQEQKDLLIELVRVERRRLHGLRLEFSSDSNEQKKYG